MYKKEGGSLFIRELCYSLGFSYKSGENLSETIKNVMDRCTAGGSPVIVFSTLTKHFLINCKDKNLDNSSNKGHFFFSILKHVSIVLAFILAIKWYATRLITRNVPIIIKASQLPKRLLPDR